MDKNKIIPFPRTINARINYIVSYHEQKISENNNYIKNLNWFMSGLASGFLAQTFIYIGIYYFWG